MVLVWDLPVRVFHWLLVISFAGAWLTSDSEAKQMLHYAFGYSACALVVFRIFWGLAGTRYSRFTQFVKGPKATLEHTKSLLTGKDNVGLGHNPAGAIAMILLILLILLISITGYLSVKDFLGDLMSEAHELISNFTIGVIGIHVMAAIFMSLIQKENLIRSMVSGKKRGTSEQAIRYPMYLIGIMLGLGWICFFSLIVNGDIAFLIR